MSEFKLTDQQVTAIDAARWGESFVLDAVAGSGKTSTAREMCKAVNGRVLYLVYNRAAARDAKDSFPQSVRVSTTAALAWGKYPEYRDRMEPGAPRVRARDTAALAGMPNTVHVGNLPMSPVTIAIWALETIKRYCYSPDVQIKTKHVPPIMAAGMDALHEEELRTVVVHWARKIWLETRDPASKHLFTFDYAFKLMIMSPPDFGYDTVILDEAQDSNRATLHLLKAQLGSQLIVIGDPGQQIYGWRGATDIMGEFDGDRLSLSRSFRFGTRIAEEAEKWLAHTETGIHIQGSPNIDSRVITTDLDHTDAVLCRSNSAVMAQAMRQLNLGKRVAIVGGTDALRNLALAARDLMNGQRTSYPELSAFADWGELMAFTQEPNGGDLKALVQLVNEYKIGGILEACNSLVAETPDEAANSASSPRQAAYLRSVWKKPDVVISTAHKSKGREWKNVEIADDFKEPDDVEDPFAMTVEPGPISRHDAMLHYVTVTRARKWLNRRGLAWIDRHPPIDKISASV